MTLYPADDFEANYLIGAAYCGNYPELGHAQCASSVECTAFCGAFYGETDVFCTLEAGHAGADHTAPTGDDDGVWAWQA